MTLSGPLFPGLLSSYKLQSWRQWYCRRPGQPQPWVGGRRCRRQRNKPGSGQRLGNCPNVEGCGRSAHVFGVVRTRPRPHTWAASTQPQTPGCVARRNEVSPRESALDSHTGPGGLISSTRLGPLLTGIFHGLGLAGWEGEINDGGRKYCSFSGLSVGPKLACTPMLPPTSHPIPSMTRGRSTCSNAQIPPPLGSPLWAASPHLGRPLIWAPGAHAPQACPITTLRFPLCYASPRPGAGSDAYQQQQK